MDYAKAAMLLQICDLANQWPSLKALHDNAMAELTNLNDEAQKAIDDRAAKAKAEADKVEEKRLADAKAKKEAEDKEAAKAEADKASAGRK